MRHQFWPYAGRLRNWAVVLRENQVDPAYRWRLVTILLMALATLPMRCMEHLYSAAVLRKSEEIRPPLFILGHARSGTTWLHNLLSLDPAFGHLTTFQAFAPELSLIGERTLKPLLEGLLPKSRKLDGVAVSLDAPQEEEIALYYLSPHAIVYRMHFPHRARYYFERYALLQGLSSEELTEWRATYEKLLRKASYLAGHKRLLLKSPGHTGRIPLLLSMFPGAQFVHIYRNPYRVFLSTRHMHRFMLERGQLQDVAWDVVEEDVLFSYEVLMRKYLQDRSAIPEGDLVEVGFEALESDPEAQLRRIYATLGLPGFDALLPALRAHLAERGDYRKNRYDLPLESIRRVNERWAFAFETWKYPQISPE